MAIFSTLLATLPLFAAALAAPNQGHNGGLPQDLVAPHVKAHPYSPANFRPAVPRRGHGHGKVCTVKSGTRDAGPYIIAAARKCNRGGTVYFPPGDYLIASGVDLTFLDDIDFAIWGTISFLQDAKYWETQTFQYDYQGAKLFWRFGGKNVNIYGSGKGVIDGDGPYWWGQMANDSTTQRPIMFGTDGLHRATISGLTMRNPPNWFNLIANSSDILVSDLNLQVDPQPKATPAKNTDGWDTYRSHNVVIQNSVIVNTDDCVSFKPNSTSVIVQNLSCTGSHGISVGSLGQYIGEVDLVEDIYVYNITMANAGNFARIKVWAGAEASADGLSGGGTGAVRNVTYDHLYSNGNDEVITLTQCYFSVNQTMCDRYPASLEISDVTFKNIQGTTTKKYDPRVGSLVCSSPNVCHNIYASDIDLVPPSGSEATYTCVNLGESELDINCI
ncbi:putative exopolygalacturonase A [Aspergillus heterothallicus]